MTAPPAPFPDAGHHGTNHTNECDESNNGVEPSDDDIRDDDPIEVLSWCRKVAMEVLFLLHSPYLFLNSVQRYEEYNRQTNYFIYLCIGFIYHQRSV